MRVGRSRFLLLSFPELDHIIVLSIEWLNFLSRVLIVYRIYKGFRVYRVHRVYRLTFSNWLYRRLGLCIAYFKILRKLNEIRERKLQLINIWQCVFARTH